KLFINAIRILHSAMIPLRIVFAMLVATTISAQADEGMWLFNNPPLRQLKENYQFEPTPQCLEHLQKASVRFNSGGSGSFVSADGLCITNHHVGAYHLYRYKRYDDVRIVFAPEQQMAFYGGDPDNFEYPRFDLDICIFRAYENGQPAKIEHYLKWNSNGPSDGELTFVSGSPGRTDRQLTVDELADRRDREVPTWLQMFNRREVLLNAWGQRSFENARRARDDFYGDQNNRKRYDGYVAALFDPEIWSAIEAREKKLRDAISRDQKLKSTTGAYNRIKKAQAELVKIALRYDYLEQERPGTVGYRGPRAFYGTLFKYARLLTRAIDERAKSNGERIAAFRDSAKESLELELFSSEPVYDDYEILRLTDSLIDFAERF